MCDATNKATDHARSNAAAWYSSICEMVAALGCDYDRLEELRTMDANDISEEEGEELRDLVTAATIDGDTMKDADEARERIQDSALSVEVRSDWYTPGADADDDARKPAEFQILLSTGGPALRIMGELDEHGEPSRAWLEYQDWGTPWTHYYIEGCGAVLLEFCGVFCFQA